MIGCRVSYLIIMNSVVRSSSILPGSVKALVLSLQEQLKEGIAVDGQTNSSKVHRLLDF